MSQIQYSFRYKKGDFEFEIHGDKGFVKTEASQFLALGGADHDRQEHPPSSERSSKAKKGKTKAIFGDYANNLPKKPTSGPQRVAVLLKYLWETEQREGTYADIGSFFQGVSWPVPSNASLVVNRMKGKGWVQQTGTGKAAKLRILEQGIRAVNDGFSKASHK